MIDRAKKAGWLKARRREMGLKWRLALALYFGLSRIIPEALVLVLVRRQAKRRDHEESAARAAERVGRGQPERPKGRVAWLHSIGPGDSTANLALIPQLLAADPGLHCVVTTRTVAAQGVFRTLAEGGRVSVVLAPHDLHRAMRRFLDHWRPSVAIICERDFWPNGVTMLEARGVPMALHTGQFNGRLGDMARRHPGFWHWMIGHLDLMHVFPGPCEEEARAWIRPDCELVVAPNLKMDAAPLPVKAAALEGVRAAWGDAPVLACASVADNEVAALIEAHGRAVRRIEGLRMILIPRWKEQADEIARIAGEAGGRVPRRSVEGRPGADDPIFLADSYGEMGAWFEASFAVFMGHTLFGGLGHNPYEPIIAQRQIIAGSIPPLLVSDYSYLRDIGLCTVAETPEAIAEVAVRLWQDRQEGRDTFVEFRAARGFSRDLAGRILALG